MRTVDHLVVARVQELLLGFNVKDVREVLNDDAVLPVPLTPPVVRGLVNLRGEVVTVIDGRCLLQMGAMPVGHRSSSLVVQRRRDLLSLEVDDVLEVIEIDATCILPRPDGMQEAVRRLAAGIVQRERDLIVVVDVIQLFEMVGKGES